MTPEDRKQINTVKDALGCNTITVGAKTVHEDGSIKETDHEVEAKQLTIICHNGDMELTVKEDDVVEINAEATVARAAKISSEEWATIRTMDRFKELVGSIIAIPEDLHASPLATRHVVGMVCLIAETVNAGKRPFLKLPETYLHPRQQAELGDMLVILSNGK